jgi:N-acetylmuramoyl-L-alanine amidase
MNPSRFFFHKSFAAVSLGFALLATVVVPCPLLAGSNNTSARREAANAQYGKAEELRNILNGKAPEKRTLAEYKRVVMSYQRVYLITPHAKEVPDALVAVAELDTEMGDRFGRSYYQAAAEAYQFLIREYPTSKYGQDSLLRLAQMQKDQLGDATTATKSYQDFLKKYPRSTHKREVQEALAELAVMKSAENGTIEARGELTSGPRNAPRNDLRSEVPVQAAGLGSGNNGGTKAEAVQAETAQAARNLNTRGGEDARSVAVPKVQKIRTVLTADSTEIVIDLEDSVQYASGRISNPDRIYFDLHTAALSPGVARGNIKVSGELLTQIRVAQNKSGIVRVVLDVNGVNDYAASLLRKPSRLVIELYGERRGNAVESAKTIAAPARPVVAEQGNPELAEARNFEKNGNRNYSNPSPVASVPHATSVPVPNAPAVKPAVKNSVVAADILAAPAPTIPEPSNGKLIRTGSSRANGTVKPEFSQPSMAPQPTRDGQSTLTRALGLKIGRIVIDAGHGGHDTGTIGPTGLMEKDLCLDVALRLGKIISSKLPGAEIVYTRSDDTFIPLEERTHIANEAKADLFISIHANSSPDHGARGVETYYLNLRGSAEAMEVAARENAVSQENIHDLQDVVRQIARTEKIDESKELAEDIQDSLAKRMQKTAKPVKNRGVRKAPFVVLIGADMPSILTEISFLSNPSDEQLLKKPEHRQHVAEGLYTGVSEYLQSLNSVAVNKSNRPGHAVVIPAVEQSRNQN